MTSNFEEFERAIASVPGVASASISVSGETGRNRLRIRLVPGEDPQAVSWAVAATLRERFGIALDPDDIRPRAPGQAEPTPARATVAAPEAAESEAAASGPPASEPGEDPTASRLNGQAVAGPAPDEEEADSGTGDLRLVAASSERPPRAVIRDLDTRRGRDDIHVTATLAFHDRQAEGRASAVPTRRGRLRAIAEATLASLDSLVDGRLQAAVDRVTLVAGDLPAASVLVTLASDQGEETLLGAALVREDDLERAVMRATLDAVNRRAEPFLSPNADEPLSTAG